MMSLSKLLQEKNGILEKQFRETTEKFLKLVKVNAAISEMYDILKKDVESLNSIENKVSCLVSLYPINSYKQLYEFKSNNNLPTEYIAKNIESILNLLGYGNYDIQVYFKEDHNAEELRVYMEVYLNVNDF